MVQVKAKRPSADSTRKAILFAAEKLFVKQGFAGTSMSEIAKLANINQSLIYHHFENKLRLWQAIKKQVMTQFAAEQGVEIESILALQRPEQVIEELVRFRFDLYDRFPNMRRLIDWQFLEHNPYELRGIKQEFLDLLIALIENFQNQNKIIPYYSADMVLAIIFHMPVGFFKTYKNMTEGYSGDALIKRKQDYVQLCIDSLVKSLVLG